MKLFYTEEEALKAKLIYNKQQEYFYWNFSVIDLDDKPTPLMGIHRFFKKRQLYIRKEIKDKGNVVLVVYVLEELKKEAISMLLNAYNKGE